MESEQKQVIIANAFAQGELMGVAGEFVPCDLITPILGMPFILIGYILPLPVLCLSFAYPMIRDPGMLGRFYQRVLEVGWLTNGVGVAIALFVLTLTTWLFIQGYPRFRLTILGLKEWQRQRRTGQYRYGLLLTPEYFALHCFSSPFDKQPQIFAHAQIQSFFLGSEYSEIAHHRIPYISMQVKQPDGLTRNLRLPTGQIDCAVHPLYAKLNHWLQT